MEAQREIIRHFEEKIPNFTDLFDERTFYILFISLIVLLIVVAIFMAVCCKVTIKDADEIAREREERKRRKQIRIAEKMLRKKVAEAAENPSLNMNEIARLEKFIETMKRQNEADNEENQMDSNKDD